jgi:nucleotide-binding universal stress UspA family protein
MTTKLTTYPTEPITPVRLERIAAAVDSHPEGDDAAVLAAAITRAVDGDLVLASIEPALPIALPLVIPGADWARMRCETKAMLGRTREAYAATARFAIDSDLSAARGLRRVLGQEHRQLVVCGSSHRGEVGKVSIGGTTRQLVEDGHYSLAIAARGLSGHGDLAIRRVGVGFDGGGDARVALAWAAAIAEGCGARLMVRGVIDDHIPALGWPNLWIAPFRECWNEVMDEEVLALRASIESTTADLSVPVSIDVARDVPAASLLDLSAASDLLVIGSRRWGSLARLLLGGTGEALARGAYCSLLIVPRPEAES